MNLREKIYFKGLTTKRYKGFEDKFNRKNLMFKKFLELLDKSYHESKPKFWSNPEEANEEPYITAALPWFTADKADDTTMKLRVTVYEQEDMEVKFRFSYKVRIFPI